MPLLMFQISLTLPSLTLKICRKRICTGLPVAFFTPSGAAAPVLVPLKVCSKAT